MTSQNKLSAEPTQPLGADRERPVTTGRVSETGGQAGRQEVGDGGGGGVTLKNELHEENGPLGGVEGGRHKCLKYEVGDVLRKFRADHGKYAD